MVNLQGSAWQYTQNERVLVLDTGDATRHLMAYSPKKGRDLRAYYSYNRSDFFNISPFFTDMMIEAYVSFSDQAGVFEAVLTKYNRIYTAAVDAAGEMSIAVEYPVGTITKLKAREIEPLDTDKPVHFRFENVDHVLKLSFGPETIEYDLGTSVDAAGKPVQARPNIGIAGTGRLVVDNLRIMRDIYHYNTDPYGKPLRASEGNPYVLNDDEFFACGDNSPSSSDSRYWDGEGNGNNGNTYPPGVVPRDYIIGKAFFVYWPGSYKLNLNPRYSKIGRKAIIPNVSEMKFIYGGKEDTNYPKASPTQN